MVRPGTPAVERGRGESRAYCIFNPAPRPRSGSVEITVWDWPEKAGMEVIDETGLSLPFQILEAGAGSYWGHTFAKILVGVGIDGLGYRTIVVKRAFGRSDDYLDNPWRHPSNLTHPPVEPVLENDELRAEFHLRELRLVSLIDKKTGRELVSDQKGGAVFRLLTEEADKTWTAWVVGRIIGTKELVDGACLTGKHLEPGALVQWLEYRLAFEASELTVRFELVRGESAVRVKVRCAFRELGDMKRGVPQLDFRLALAEPSAEYHYDIPFGTITRGPIMHDVPAVSWMAAEVGDGSRIMLITRTKNSFRGDGESMALPLIRGTTNPDPYPEVGTHDIEFAVSVVRERTGAALADTAEDYLLPFSAVSTSASGGSLPPRGSFLTIESAGIRIASIKNAEDESGMILRLFETEGTAGTAEIRLGSPVKGAEWVDAHEHPEKDQGDIAVSGNTVTAALGPFRMRSVKLVPAV